MHGSGELAFFGIGLISTTEHIGVDHTWAYRVDTDFFLRELDRRRLGQADHRVLGARVDAHQRRGAQTGHRCGINDRSASLG
ncbi:hypothetical protein D3C72_1815870 [compost metagenome]